MRTSAWCAMTRSEERPVGLLVTHAALGTELLRTVERILGAQTDAFVLSNDGYSGEALSRAIEDRVGEVPAGGVAHPEHDLSAYKAVVVPQLYLLTDAAVRNLLAYVRDNGGEVPSAGRAPREALVRAASSQLKPVDLF